jgi:CIC family chloride channel protein
MMDSSPRADASRPDDDGAEPVGEGSIIGLACMTLIAGAATGLMTAVFRLLLERAADLRAIAIVNAQSFALAGFLLVVMITAALSLAAAWMVRRLAPHATGSGIPQVEAVLHGVIPPAGHGLAAVKFAGGLLALGSGLVLGREGPSVQMGAAVSFGIGRLFGRKWTDCRVMLASGAGAGLATAFNAPSAGAVFVLEELVQRFEHRIAVAALGAAGSAIAVARLIIGHQPDFQVATFLEPGMLSWPLFGVLGGLAGLLAVGYNRSILGALAVADASSRWLPVEGRAALIGALIGAVAWFAPGLVGGGDDLTQQILSGGAVLAAVPAIFALRFMLGAASYAAGTPGGLFAPMLVLGAQIGLVFGALCGKLPFVELPPEAFAVVGMAAFFSGVVRAPLTGIILVGEMTGSTTLLVPMIFASFSALLAAALLRDRPIYDALRDRTIRLDERLRNNAAVQQDLR